LEWWRVEGRQEAIAPRVVLVRAKFGHQVAVFTLALITMGWMNVFSVGGVETILDRPLVVVVDFEHDQRRAPLVRTMLVDRHDGRALVRR
ncbi:MAG: hypothetical protein ACK55I_32285, partial [bacterium]